MSGRARCSHQSIGNITPEIAVAKIVSANSHWFCLLTMAKSPKLCAFFEFLHVVWSHYLVLLHNKSNLASPRASSMRSVSSAVDSLLERLRQTPQQNNTRSNYRRDGISPMQSPLRIEVSSGCAYAHEGGGGSGTQTSESMHEWSTVCNYVNPTHMRIYLAMQQFTAFP